MSPPDREAPSLVLPPDRGRGALHLGIHLVVAAGYVAIYALRGRLGVFVVLMPVWLWGLIHVSREFRLSDPVLVIDREGLSGSVFDNEQVPWSDVLDVRALGWSGLEIVLREDAEFWRVPWRRFRSFFPRLRDARSVIIWGALSKQDVDGIARFTDEHYRRIPRPA